MLFAAQAVRAFSSGLGAVLLGATLEERGFSTGGAGMVLAAVLAGTVLASLVVGRWADGWGRRRCYQALYVALGVAGVAFAYGDTLWLLVPTALTGALSTDVVESGPFTSLEQAMLASDLPGRARLRGFGTYNAVATAAGSLGALAAGGLGPLRDLWPGAPGDERAFLVFVPVSLAGALRAGRLSAAVELDRVPPPGRDERRTPGTSRPRVLRLSALFATDSFGGGFVVQSFIAYWLTVRFGATVGSLGVLFFAVGLLQTASMLVAPRLAELVLEPSAGDGETVVITVWPDHETFDAWIATPERDRLTASEVHRAVDYRPITRYDVVGGYLNIPGLTDQPGSDPTEENSR